jgi:hypothetical protein
MTEYLGGYARIQITCEVWQGKEASRKEGTTLTSNHLAGESPIDNDQARHVQGTIFFETTEVWGK